VGEKAFYPHFYNSKSIWIIDVKHLLVGYNVYTYILYVYQHSEATEVDGSQMADRLFFVARDTPERSYSADIKNIRLRVSERASVLGKALA
jgi:hypothetical protein